MFEGVLRPLLQRFVVVAPMVRFCTHKIVPTSSNASADSTAKLVSRRSFDKDIPAGVTTLPLLYAKAPSVTRSETLTPYVNSSQTLRNMVDIGVNLKLVEQNGAAELILKLDWQRDVLPLCRFLFKNGVDLTDLGSFVGSNPWIFKENPEDLQVRVNYLESKRFSHRAIGRILTVCPSWLNFDVRTIDGRLGWFQEEFSLAADQLRFVVVKQPSLIADGTGNIKVLRPFMNGELGFVPTEMKQLLLNDPSLWTAEKERIKANFEYLHRRIGFSHRRMTEYPQVLHCDTYLLKTRNRFLKFIDRDQYDPSLPNFVPISLMIHPDDAVFCQRAAKCSIATYNDYLSEQ